MTGKVLYRGNPAAGAVVSFHPLDTENKQGNPQILPNATCEKDGTFILSTYLKNDGAPAGEYAVTIFWPGPNRRVKHNRLVNKDRQGRRPLSRTEIAASGTQVWLQGYGLVMVFKIVAPDGGIAYWASSDLSMTNLTRQQMAEHSWAIETYHRGIKQHTEVERCQARSERAQLNHIGLALRAFLRLEYHLFTTGVSWAAAKAAIIRDAVRAYLAHPSIRLPTA